MPGMAMPESRILQESAGESERWGGEGSERGELMEYGEAGGDKLSPYERDGAGWVPKS